jgi:hypothetical protein
MNCRYLSGKVGARATLQEKVPLQAKGKLTIRIQPNAEILVSFDVGNT